MSVGVDISNQKYGYLTALIFCFYKNKKVYWLCKCHCGNLKAIRKSHLMSGLTKSCGCFKNKMISIANGTHHKRNSSIYNRWIGMRDRCYNKNSRVYYRYGGRGITVCEKWRYSFENFLKDMGEPIGKNYSIDRIDNDVNYEPANCRWATPREQSLNRKSNIFLEYKGRVKCQKEWAQELGINQNTISKRVKRGESFDSIYERYAL